MLNFEKFPNPTLIQGPTGLIFDNFSNPIFISCPTAIPDSRVFTVVGWVLLNDKIYHQ